MLHHGRMAEEGSHTELLEVGGLYAKLHELQFVRGSAASGVDQPSTGRERHPGTEERGARPVTTSSRVSPALSLSIQRARPVR